MISEEAKRRAKNYMGLKDVMDAETIEEAAERYSHELYEAKTIQYNEKSWIKSVFIWVAKWQSDRMYSEEDLKKAIDLARDYNDGWLYTVEEIFKQLKKK